jgi:hypothetical protein
MKLSKLFVVLLLVLLAGGGYLAWSEIESNKLALADLEQKNVQLTQESETLKQQASASELAKNQAAAQLQEMQKANCKGVWSDETGCEEPKPVFSHPMGGEDFCFGKTVEVKWDATLVKAESVDVMLATSSNSGKLATLKNEGTYSWKLETPHKTVGDTGSFTIAAGMYRLRLQSADGILLGKDTELFTVKKCGAPAKAASLPNKKAAPSKKR